MVVAELRLILLAYLISVIDLQVITDVFLLFLNTDIRFGKNLSSEDCVHNLDLFRTLCSQFICTSVLALKVEDLLYGSQAMKPNVIALLAEVFNKCEVESQSNENGVKERPTYESDVDLRYIVANKENVMDNRSSSAPILNSDKNRVFEHGSPRETIQGKNERSSSMSGRLKSSTSDRIEQLKSSGTQGNTNSRLSFKSPFQLDFTVDDDVQQPTLNKPLLKQDVHEKDTKEKKIHLVESSSDLFLLGTGKVVYLTRVQLEARESHQDKSTLFCYDATSRNKEHLILKNGICNRRK